VTGCSAQTEAAGLSALGGNVCVVPQSEKSRLLEIPRVLAEAFDEGPVPQAWLLAAVQAGAPAEPFALTATDFSFHTRAFLKIQDGCDCRCAYCRVPQARGTSVSLGLEEVLKRAAALESQGRREIVLTGVNISAWRAGGTTLPGLLREVLGSTSSARIRLTSLEPESLTPELVEVVAEPRICPHFHIPVQSGSDSVLAQMRRRYKAGAVFDGIRKLREVRDDPFVAADILVGFPGETGKDFERTREMVRRLEFAALHVFPFSPRPGTAAAAMHSAVPERVRRERARTLAVLAEEAGASYVRRWMGRKVEVLLEGKGSARPHGVSANYLKVTVNGMPRDTAAPGRVVRAEITGAGRTCAARFLGFAD
jgi:threonylcarbamoyladenosine tRNA methylthiotransferase MtaB